MVSLQQHMCCNKHDMRGIQPNISVVSPPPAVVTHVVLELVADACVEQHHVRPQSSERQHLRRAGGDPERAARVIPAEAGTREADAAGSAAPPSGTVCTGQ